MKLATGDCQLASLFLFATTCCLPPTALASAAEGGADADLGSVLSGLQKMYEGAKDFSADFEQTYRSVHGGMKSESAGRIMFAKPGKVRWEYAKPRPRTFVASGSDLWIWSPEDNQVMQSKKFQQNQLSVALAFLYGRGKLEEEFTAALVKTYETGWTLKLVPKKDMPQLVAMKLEVSNASYLVTGVEIEDALGNRNTFKFDKPSLNSGLKDDLFTFKPPPDAEIAPLPEGFLK
ncbi:MAG: outer membrane lipoprotein carrier protein LolA [Deltaproteobacteria bacterium]|nr:outer membrane lipoprotein carrier protein LolA [Deltaproteobacteria bacterium]